MNSYKISNHTEEKMLLAFEPTGEVFRLPPKEFVRIILTEPDSGGDVDALDIQFQFDNGISVVAIWAELYRYKVFYKEEEIFTM